MMAKTGIRIGVSVPVLLVCAVPALGQIGIFESEVDWPLIGEFKEPGSVSVSGTSDSAVYTLKGNGNCFCDSNNEDEGFYVYKVLTGSWSLQARVSLKDLGYGPWGSAGVMIRESADAPNSRHYSVVYRSDDQGARTQNIYRNLVAFPGLPTQEFQTPDGQPVADPGDGVWIRVTHVAPLDLFYSEYSLDGVEWILGHLQVFPWGADELAYGLAITSLEDSDYVAEAEIRNVEFQSPPPIASRSLSQASFKAGDAITVTLDVFNLADTPVDVTIKESIPSGWAARAITDGGSLSNEVITWNLSIVTPGKKTISYQVNAPPSPANRAEWSGSVEGSLAVQGKSGLLMSEGGFERVSDGLLVLYTFNEGGGETVHDVSEVGDPLDLTIRDTGLVSWGQGFLSVNGATKIKSGVPATKIIEPILESNAISIEAWVAPNDAVQSGPARIVTLSDNASNRNFTLGQSGTEYHVRLRTPDTGNNGSDPALTSPSGIVTTVLTHVLYTRDEFWSTILYVNNEVIVNDDNIFDIQGSFIEGDIVGWNEGYEFGLANEINAERPWQGDLHLVAVYNRALTEDEIAQNFAAGPSVGLDVGVEDWSLH